MCTDMERNKYDGNTQANAEMARDSEEIARELLNQLMPGQGFLSVHDEQELWHYGDIVSKDGKYFDVKDDGRICDTGNVFAEECKRFYSNPDELADGWMKNSKYDYVCILDLIKQNMYVLDFAKLKKIYKNSSHKYAPSYLSDCISWGYCVPLSKCRKQGIIVAETGFVYDDDFDCYDLTELNYKKK